MKILGKLDYCRFKPVYWIYSFVCLFYYLDLSHGGYQDHQNSNKYNGIVTQNPLKSLVNTKRHEPYFDPNVPKNITALVGKSAYLNCIVKNLGNKTVSWIRHRDLHILTVASYTYTTDQRFQTTHHRATDEWTLHIKWVQKRDAGMYECQVSTQPVRSYSVRLNVIDFFDKKMMNNGRFYGSPLYHPMSDDYNVDQYDEYSHPRHDFQQQNPYNDIYGRMYSDRFYVPIATILGGPDYYIDKGSTINLTCIVKFSMDPLAYTWRFNNEIINFDSKRGGITILSENGETQTSYLLISEADVSDSGRYSCEPSNAEKATIRVHVLNGEHPEAMQTGCSQSNSSINFILLMVILLNICNYFRIQNSSR